MKFIVYYSDNYYPLAEEYDDYAKANEAFVKLKAERTDSAQNESVQLFDKDYLCIVLSEIDVDKLKELIKLRDDLDDHEDN